MQPLGAVEALRQRRLPEQAAPVLVRADGGVPMAKSSPRHRVEAGPLYLKKVVLENVRCFEKVKVDFRKPDGHPRMWAVVLGDNSVGKTTLLRSIAMGLCDEASAAGLLREIYGEWNREIGGDGELRPAKIHLEFFATEDAEEISVTTIIEPNPLGYSKVKQRTKYGSSTKDFPWERIFACGYGAARRGFGTKDIDDYATLDAVYTLFNYDVPLQNPELVLRRIEAAKKDLGPVLDSIAEVLQLGPQSIALTERGLSIKGDWGAFQAIRGLGDGYQATLAWITDLLGWALFYDTEADLSEISGLVLIDELEQHLHPRWQRRIVGLLSGHFPRLQFVATTHTPMCAIGTTDLADGEAELVILRRDGDKVIAVEDIAPPKGLRADQVLTSDLFGLATTSSDDLTQAIARYSQLRGKADLSIGEREEEERLFDHLQNKLTRSETPFETEVRIQVTKALESFRRRAFDDEARSFDKQSVEFEVLRQLRKLASP
jgi:hypothetical protein